MIDATSEIWSDPHGSKIGDRVQAYGAMCRGIRVIWRKLDCLKPTLTCKVRVLRVSLERPGEDRINDVVLVRNKLGGRRAGSAGCVLAADVRHASFMSGSPYTVRWTAHALGKVEFLGIDRAEVERSVLKFDHVRRRNPGSAGWRITAGRLVILYEHPDEGDPSAARIVTVWRKR